MYLENLFSEDLYKQKTEELRKEEEGIKKVIALGELKELERERSKAYLDRVSELLDGYDPDKKVMDAATKKLMLGLLFKNIKIAPPPSKLRRTSLKKSRKSRKEFFALEFFDQKLFAPEFFDPFNFLLSEEKEKCQLRKNKRVMKNHPEKSSSGLSDGRISQYAGMILGLLKRLSDLE